MTDLIPWPLALGWRERWAGREQALPAGTVVEVELPDTRDDPPAGTAELINKVCEPRRPAAMGVQAIKHQRGRFGPIPLPQDLPDVRIEAPSKMSKRAVGVNRIDGQQHLVTGKG